MKKSISILVVLISIQVQAQDTLRIMAYNCMNYSSTGTYASRYVYLREVINYVKPDILVAQEIFDAAGAQLLLDSGLNAAFGPNYSRATFVDGPDSDNVLFYNNAKVNFQSQDQIATALRNITRYRIYYLNSATDTVWLNMFSVHLKASTGFEPERLAEVQNMCTFFSGLNSSENIIVGGDFNLYTNAEPAWSWMTTTSCAQQLYDPINRVGAWNNNSLFKDVHTQSTRLISEPDGGNPGGLDDRFDFILSNLNVLNGSRGVRFVPGSYKSVGNDANHFNAAVNGLPTNTAVSATVANALYYMSDHTPVVMDVVVGSQVGLPESMYNATGTYVTWLNDNNNFSGISEFIIDSDIDQALNLSVIDISGRLIINKSQFVFQGENRFTINSNVLDNGTYILKIQSNKGEAGIKFIVRS